MSPRIMRALAVPAAAIVGLTLTGAAAAPGAAAPPRPPYGYVTNSGSGDVTPFDTALNRPGRPIPVTGSPGALVISRDGRMVYVASTAGVTPIGTNWNKAGKLIPITGGAANMVIKPNGATLYVTTGTPSTTRTTVIPVSTVTKKAGKPITFAPGPGRHPSPLVITPDAKTVYVASALGTVTPISAATGKAGKPIPFGFKDANGTAHLAITPDGKTLYAFGSSPNRTVTTVTPIRTATGKPGKPVTVGQGPEAIVFSPDSKEAYVASTGEGPKAYVRAKVTPIRTATNKPSQFTNLGPTATDVYLGITPNGKKIYVSALWYGNHGSNEVISVSAVNGTVLKRMRPSYPRSIAFTPDGKTAFIVDVADSRAMGIVVSVTTATDTYHPGFWVGWDPAAIAITP